MANLRGEGAMTGRDVVVIWYDKGVHTRTNKKGEEKKVFFADVQLNTDPSVYPEDKFGKQSNPHLHSQRQVDKDGNPVLTKQGDQRWSYTAPYYPKQMAAIRDVAKASGNMREVLNKDGERVGYAFAVKGNLFSPEHGSGLLVDTKSLQPSDYKLPKTWDEFYKGQIERTKAAAAERRAEREAAEQAKQAQAPQASGPDFGGDFQAAAQAAAGTTPAAQAPQVDEGPSFEEPAAAEVDGPDFG